MSDSRSSATDQPDGGVEPEKKRWLHRLALSIGLLAAGLFLTFPLDFRTYHTLERIDRPVFQHLAQQLSLWGDYFPGSILVSVLLFAGGWVARSRRARLAALASLLAATASGLTVDAGRFSLGRPRPYATAAEALTIGYRPVPRVSFGRIRPDNDLLDGFYGPVGIHMFQGFPSGHAASSMASAIAIVPLVPELGLPLSLLSAGVCWSRMELRQHYLSDVTVGATWGALWGIYLGGLFSRRITHRPRPAPASPPKREI
ncbi:phosphatase PAP2 family protein [Methylacidimicrobium sp. B4]|uniref:phosphatase PAP2 family protein n=1 Tax=Methylacidimicrobium sp. B4 TaxID=2796139 RepID=UPI001A8E3171|nr:phosphatase PAP2 family protein [Methylacidimicrobium sp. B4]QSR85055.1 phosphatase PAP2 family protein [Methylacidimicrobium sp. B4]